MRFIPPTGFTIGNIDYRDVNDNHSLRGQVKEFVLQQEDYKVIENCTRGLYGKVIGRRLGAFGWHKDKLIGISYFGELLDNPDGYGEGDFLHGAFLLPNYKGTMAARLIHEHLQHILFWVGLMRRLYYYIPVSKEGGSWVDRVVEQNICCWGKVTPNRIARTTSYVHVRKTIPVQGEEVLLLEYNGDDFRRVNGEFQSTLFGEPKGLKDAIEKVRKELCLIG